MATERRFLTEFRETATTDSGLVLTDAGEVEVVKPDGSRVGVANGGSQPITNREAYNGNAVSVANGDAANLIQKLS